MQTDPQLSAVVNRIMEVRAEAVKLRPVNRALYEPKSVEEPEPCDDESWKGEDLLRKVKKANASGSNMKTNSVNERIALRTIRRTKVGPLFATGMTSTNIAAELGVSMKTINTDLEALGLK